MTKHELRENFFSSIGCKLRAEGFSKKEFKILKPEQIFNQGKVSDITLDEFHEKRENKELDLDQYIRGKINENI